MFKQLLAGFLIFISTTVFAGITGTLFDSTDCQQYGLVAGQMQENRLTGTPDSKLLTSVIGDMAAYQALPEDVKLLTKLMAVITSRQPREVTGEQSGMGFVKFCYSFEGNVEEMNKVLKDFLKIKELDI